MKITAIALIGLGVAAILRRQPAALRHWVLACAVACAAAMPMVSLLIPAWQVGLAQAVSTTAANISKPIRAAANRQPLQDIRTSDRATATTASTVSPDVRPLSWWLAPGWIAGAAIGIGMIIVGLLRLSWLGHRARSIAAGPWREIADRLSNELGLSRRVNLLQSDHPSLLVTWGTLRPKIIVPAPAAAWPPERISVVLRHELAHVERCDWAVQVTAELLKSVYWFNPVLWIVVRKLRLESEHACDDAVMNGGIQAASYASHLVDLARALNLQPRTWLPAPAIARSSSLHRRVTAMLNAHLNRQPIPRSLRTAVAATLLAITVPIAAAQAPFATVSGTVVDSTGGTIAGATLTISNTATQARHEVKSDATGHFELVGLPAGEYLLEASEMGFAVSRESLTLSPRQLMAKTIALQLGSLQETITVVDSAAPPNTQRARARGVTAAPKPCTVAAGGGRIVPPTKTVDVRPKYPSNLRPVRASGQVEMEATIGLDGLITDVQVASSPFPDMSAAAVEAVRQWQFTPTLLNCAPVNVNMHVLVSFRPLE